MWISRLIDFLIVSFATVGLLVWVGPESVALSPGKTLYLVEGTLLLGILSLIVLRRSIVRPLVALINGMDLLKGQDFSSRLAKVGYGEVDKIIDLFNHMIRQLKVERLTMREQNHFLDLLISVSPMGILILDKDGSITLANKSAAAFLGYQSSADISGLRLGEVTSPLAVHLLKMGKDVTETVRLSDATVYRCSSLSFMDNGYAHPFILVEKLTEEVVKAERRAYEKVIRMMAHEVNNSVGAIISSMDTVAAILDEESDENLRELAEVLRLCKERSGHMSSFVTSFAKVVKIPEVYLSPSNLNERIEASRRFIEGMCASRNVRLEISLADGRGEAMIDPVLFEQVLINIVKNSIESIELTGHGGTVEITTYSSPTRLVISDDGVGISEEAQSHLFTPFYTSKAMGQGLGLILISDILHKHGCIFSLSTSPEDGKTYFDIRFPSRQPATDNGERK